MKHLITLPILLCLLCSCATPVHVEELAAGSQERALVVWRLDNLCKLTGLRRVGPIAGCQKRTDAAGPTFHCRAFLEYHREPVRYHIHLDGDKRVTSYAPANMTLSASHRSDTLRGGKRMALLTAVKRANATLGLGCFGNPIMQKTGDHYVVTFLSMPEHMLKEAKRTRIDPYISFLVTESGKVFGVIRGK